MRFKNLPPPFDIWQHDHPQRVGPGDYFVGAPFQVCENSGQGKRQPLLEKGSDCGSVGELSREWFWAAPLECDKGSAHVMDWHGVCNGGVCTGGLLDGEACTTNDDCVDFVHIYHEGIIPSDRLAGDLGLNVYEVQVVDADVLQVEGCYSDPLTMTQAIWGDICGAGPGGACSGPPDGSATVAQDVLGCIDKFQNLNNLQKSRSDLVPGDNGINNGPDFKVTIAGDTLFALDAFCGAAYPFSPGDPCEPGTSAMRLNRPRAPESRCAILRH